MSQLHQYITLSCSRLKLSYFSVYEASSQSFPGLLRIVSHPADLAPNVSIMELYHRLNSDEKHFKIRICTLLPRSHVDDPVTCKLETLELVDYHIDYEALSYAWGSSENKAAITVNGFPFLVTQNLNTALKYLSYESKPRALWIDAISINQSDANERNSQVRSMGRIYSCATRVISWIGLEEATVNLVKQMKSAKSVIEMVKSCSKDQFFERLMDGPDKVDILESFEAGIYSLQLVIGERKYRPLYWQRAWITQEVALARSWILQAGTLWISEEDIETVTRILQHPHAMTVMKRKYQERRLRALMGLDSFLSVSLYRSLLPFSGALRLESAIHSPNEPVPALVTPRTRVSWPLLSLLRHNRSKSCADPKDRVYSILAVSDMKYSESKQVEIDYTKSLSKIYTDCVKAIIETHSSLEVLSYVNMADRIDSLDLPSWVPNWSINKPSDSADRPVSYGHQRAMGTLPAQVEFLECSGREILVSWGICFGTVMGLRDPMVNINPDRMKEGDQVAQFTEYVELYRELPLAFKQLSEAAHPQPLSCESFRRTCSFGLLQHQVDDSFQELLDDLELVSSTDNKPTPTVVSIIARIGFRYRTMASCMVGRSIFLVKPSPINSPEMQLDWEIGIGEANSVQDSDLVCLLQGCGSPLILRPKGSQYMVVCAAYIDSLMAGFGLDCITKGLFKTQKFQLL
jgi:hypothetical protein